MEKEFMWKRFWNICLQWVRTRAVSYKILPLSRYGLIYGSGKMGDEDIRRKRRNYRFPFCMIVGILGKIDESWYDSDTFDKSPYDVSVSMFRKFDHTRL